MEIKRRLNGGWKFVGAQRFGMSGWESSENYCGDLVWDFQLQYISSKRSVGVIVESGSAEGETTLPFVQLLEDDILKVEAYDDDGEESVVTEIDFAGDSSTDIYQIGFVDLPSGEQPEITLSILSEPNSPPPYFRYRLQKID